MNPEKELEECISRIMNDYLFEIIELLDKVLYDDDNDPEYSANTLIRKINDYVLFHRMHYGKDLGGIEDFLQECGYPKDVKNKLYEKQKKELEKRASLPYYYEL